MSRTEEVSQALKEGQPLFFPGADRPFKKAFQQRWYSYIKNNAKRRIKTHDGTYQGETGVFITTEEIR